MSIDGYTQVDTSVNLIAEIINYIQLDKKRDSEHHNQFKIYVLDISKEDSLQSGYSITIGYIMNSSKYKYVKTKYFFELNKDIILVNLIQGITCECLNQVNLQKINVQNEYKLVQKLYPNDYGIISGENSGLIANFNKNCIKISSTYYDNMNSMPFERSIYSKFPQINGKIELIKEGY